jgi:hypothetical protein
MVSLAPKTFCGMNIGAATVAAAIAPEVFLINDRRDIFDLFFPMVYLILFVNKFQVMVG